MNPTQLNLLQLHPQLSAFSSDFEVRNELMESNIGREVLLDNRRSRFGESGDLVHKIIGIQKLKNGSVCYRVTNELNDFGRVIDVSDIKRFK